jgi:hypothetical protein
MNGLLVPRGTGRGKRTRACSWLTPIRTERRVRGQLVFATSYRVGVVEARPCWRAAGGVVGVDNAHDRAVRSRDKQEGPADQDEDVDADQEAPFEIADLVVPVVVEPHAGHWVEAHQRSEQRSDERDQFAEDGDAAGNAVGDDGHSERAGEP